MQVQTNLQQVDVNKFTFQLDDAENINHIVVFLLGTLPFQPGYAATVHLLWPNKKWQLLGMLSNEKASAIFRLKSNTTTSRSPVVPSSSSSVTDMSMDNNNITASPVPITATLGISMEPIDVVMAQIASLSTGTSSTAIGSSSTALSSSLVPSNALVPLSTVGSSNVSPDSVAAVAQKVMSHLYNHVTSFATAVLPPGSTALVPIGGPGSALNVLSGGAGSSTSAESSFLPVKAFNDCGKGPLNIVQKAMSTSHVENIGITLNLDKPSSSSSPSDVTNSNRTMSSSRVRTVPSPRPGELLIYDCRLRAESDRPPRNGIREENHHQSSPPTPTPTPTPAPAPAAQEAAFVQRITEVELNSGEDTNATSAASNTAQPRQQRTSKLHRPIRCLQWNIERNYKPAEILATLTEIDADILCIQEIDIGCHRSGHERDHFLEICRSQGLYGGFVPEFWELEHPGRKDRDQGGGVHGNAILSKWPVNGFRVLDHVHHAYEWERDGLKLNEPRLGRRFTIVADIQTPSGPLLCYCAHLEVFTGIVGRISALSDILADSELYSDRYPYQILFGDLNTISHSIARLAKTISTDQYRIGSVGSQEAEWWDRNLWSWHVQDGEFNLALATGGWNWLRRIGFLGMGTGTGISADGCEGGRSHGVWPSDAKYTGWLKRLVKAGLDAVRQAREEQLLNDLFVSMLSYQRHGNDDSIVPENLYAFDAADEAESTKSYRGDGSVVMVGRLRTPSIITLESSLMDRSESISPESSSAWSSPTTAFLQHSELQDESDDEDFSSEPSREFRLRKDKEASVRDSRGSTSTPSTPSPTFRLIPPTPKQSRPNTVFGSLPGEADVDDFVKWRDQERGIPLPYEDEDEDDVDLDNQSQQQDVYKSCRQQHAFMGTQPHDNELEYPNDPNAIMTFTTTTATTTEMTSQLYDCHNTTKIAATTATAMTSMTSAGTTVLDSNFKDPQPPFLLSTLQDSHPFFSAMRLWSGFTPLVLHQARNPGFYDPWCARNDLTLHNPIFFGILKAKLDYTLLKNLKCVGRQMGNHDYSASDHKWLLVEVEFEREFRTRVGNKDGDGVGSNRTQGSDVLETKEECDNDEQERAMPSKEQQYRWWRERRLEWGQTIQPVPSHLEQDSTLLSDGQVRSRQHCRHQQRKERASIVSMQSVIAAAVAAAAVGGLWLLGRRK
ncbi:hypothetical protein BGX28_002539 [Mortierella sp. GBA30]|nr:hypothetical protein BGX28_002539 [Mortierella sp. GBA30]